MQDDPKAYYSSLGVSPTASLEDIKAVYRALVKIYHPDTNQDRAAAEKFRVVTEAYQVLSDPDKRRIYDEGPDAAQPWSNGRPFYDIERAAPVRCSHCGKVSVQPRYLTFKRIVGLIFTTRISAKAGVYCSGCASRIGFKASALTAALGWWGLPWGPVHTLRAIFGNALGGERDAGADEELLWHNANAFFGTGRLQLAAALAARLVASANEEIASGARALAEKLADKGIEAQDLRPVWSPNFGAMASQLLLAAIAPGLVALAVLGGSSGYMAGARPSFEAPRPAYDGALRQVAYATEAVPLPKDLCGRHPKNGTILTGMLPETKFGHRLTIRNRSSADAIVKLRSAVTGRELISFFAARNKIAKLADIPDGQYKIQFAYGEAMTEDCQRFIRPTANEFPEVKILARQTEASKVVTESVSLKLDATGKKRPERISVAAFNAD